MIYPHSAITASLSIKLTELRCFAILVISRKPERLVHSRSLKPLQVFLQRRPQCPAWRSCLLYNRRTLTPTCTLKLNMQVANTSFHLYVLYGNARTCDTVRSELASKESCMNWCRLRRADLPSRWSRSRTMKSTNRKKYESLFNICRHWMTCAYVDLEDSTEKQDNT